MQSVLQFTTAVVLQGLFIGVVIAVLAVGYNKLIIGRFVKALIKAEANHPAFAKSFTDLDVNQNIFIKLALRKGSTLKKMVAELDGDEIKYYIPEDKLYRAGRMYGGKDVDALMLAAIIILLFLFFGVFLYYFPYLWQFIENTFSAIGESFS